MNFSSVSFWVGINSASDLPKIREVLAEQLVEGTRPEDFTDLPVAENIGSTSLGGTLAGEEADISEVVAVNEDGELILAPEETEGEATDTSENIDSLTKATETEANSENHSEGTDADDDSLESDAENKDQPE